MEKLPISLCMIVRNSGKRLAEVINKHKDLVSEVLVLDQDSEDETGEIATKMADVYVKRRNKGFCEPDRNYLFSLAKQPYILNLDDDEELSPEAVEVLERLIKSRGDIFFFRRQNLVDGIDIQEIMGDDPQPRLWKNGAMRWPDSLHVYPEPAEGVKVFYLREQIVHKRTLEGLKKANLSRNRIADKENIEKQTRFVAAVEDFMSKAKSGN